MAAAMHTTDEPSSSAPTVSVKPVVDRCGSVAHCETEEHHQRQADQRPPQHGAAVQREIPRT
jgi:hypothetical protein